MAQFSGALRITDLNDFIAPSQACVVALDGKRKQQQEGGGDEGVGMPRLPLRPQAHQRYADGACACEM
eukprot:157146-Chlamydomonas_euryale.AAC.7